MTRTPALRVFRPRAARVAAAGVLLLGVLCAAAPASAETAADLYKKALAREDALRTAPAPPLAAFRATVTAYENVVLQYYMSGYCDNALWQGAGVALTAYERFGDEADKRTGLRLLAWLRKEYPASPYVKHVDQQMKAFDAVHAVAPAAAVAAPATSRTVVTPPVTPPITAAVTPPVATPAPLRAPSAAPLGPPPASSSAKPAAAPAVIRAIQLAPLPHGERVTVELDAGVSYASDRIANPDRVFVDLRNATASDAVIDRAQALSGALVSTVRCAPRADQSTRIVLELKGHPRHSAYVQYNPFRLVIDLEGDAPAAAAASPPPDPKRAPEAAATAASEVHSPLEPAHEAARPGSPAPSSSTSSAPSSASPLVSSASSPAPAPPAATTRGGYTLGRQLGLGVSRIVIDAGHGGHDPGAQSNGITESELTLDIAQRLQKLLEDRPGMDVVLTRNTDEFIPLEERTALANREGADLFLSIHANANTQPTARGVETYFLNFANTPAAEAVAARENESSAARMSRLPALVKSITLNNKLAESRELATMVQAAMVKRLTAQNPTLRDLGVKQAPFVVLIGAEMPSVLAEISFVTNRAEATLLKQSSYRQKIAQSLFDAVVKYQSSLKKVATIAGKDPGR